MTNKITNKTRLQKWKKYLLKSIFTADKNDISKKKKDCQHYFCIGMDSAMDLFTIKFKNQTIAVLWYVTKLSILALTKHIWHKSPINGLLTNMNLSFQSCMKWLTIINFWFLKLHEMTDNHEFLFSKVMWNDWHNNWHNK